MKTSEYPKLCLCVGCGIIFGIAQEKGRVFEPNVIQAQMLMNQFIMLKMFVAAVASGMVGFSVLSMLPSLEPYYRASYNDYTVKLAAEKTYVTSIVGGAILGCGMTISGACPGMVLAQVGAGTQNAMYTVLGGLAGAALYGIVEPTITSMTRPRQPATTSTLQQLLGGPYFAIALPMASFMAIGLFGLELIRPWKSELSVPNSPGVPVFAMRAWSPIASGAIIGLLQVPIAVLTGKSLGSSSSYCTIVSQLFRGPLNTASHYLNNYKGGYQHWWQVMFVFGVVLGGYISASSSGTYSTTPGVSPIAALSGGALMIFGSRIAAGCTSGHGLSGMGLLNLFSFAAVPAMFAGGIATAVAAKYI